MPRPFGRARLRAARGPFAPERRVPARVAMGRHHTRGRRRGLVGCSPPKFNPQNVEEPTVVPSLGLKPSEVVSLQLNALKSVHEPWVNHGIQVCYGFCEGSGSMERSRYFGYSKDLYHFDHFLGQFQNAFPELLGLESFEIVEVQEGDEPLVQVAVKGAKGEAPFTFALVERQFGARKGCLMTSQIIKGK